MLLCELDTVRSVEDWNNVAPGVYQTHPGIIEIADWWDADETPTGRIYVTSFIENSTDYYTRKISFADCVAESASFYWDDSAQLLTVHFAVGSSWYTSDYQYARVTGFTDQGIVYVDNVEYLPLILSAPGVEQQEDLANYDKLAFISGSIVFDNKAGDFDYLVDTEIYGYGVQYKYLDPSDIIGGNTTRDKLVDLASLYVEDYDHGLRSVSIRIQDKRKAQNYRIPREVFRTSDYPDIEDKYVSKPIPLIYGPINAIGAIPVNGEDTGDVTFKVAKTLTTIGLVQVFENDVWTTVTPASIDLDTGSFVLEYEDCRKGGTTIGDILPVRITSCTGEAITDSADVIRLINLEAQGTAFTESNYDITEWNLEKSALSQIGVAFTEKIEVFEAIRQIQNGSNVGFRYEIKPDGRRTIRIDDNDREPIGTIQKQDIRNLAELTINTDTELIAATATVNYGKDYEADEYRTYFDDTRRDTVLRRYLQEPDYSVDTFLQTESLAQDKAEWILDRFDTVPRTVSLELMGKQWYDLLIYDIVNAELTPGFVDLDRLTVTGRAFYGIWKIKIIAVDPQLGELVNVVTAQLIEKIGG